jgi:hypothetical protein
MATACQSLVQLPQEDLQKLLAEVTALRQEVLFLREEREVHQQRLALSDARIQVLEEGQKVTDVSPPTSPAHPVQAEPSDSEIEMEETVEPAEEAPFTLVQGKHQRKRPTPESAPMTQAVKSGPSGEPSQARAPKMPKLPTPEVPQTQKTQPAPVKPVTQQKPPAESKIPPVIIRDASKWSSLSQAMMQKKINFSKARSCVDGIRVNPVTVDDFRSMTRLLEARGVPFHTFALPEEKTLRAVLRTVPVEISVDDVKADLENQGLAPKQVTRMISTRSKKPLPLVLVEVPKDQGKIFQLKSICHLLIAVERPHKKGTTAQCHRCQRFHHSQRNCYAPAKCVKCGEFHDSHLCKKAKSVPAKCANCGGAHTASYRGCPRFPRGYQGKKSPNHNHSGPQQKRAPATTAAPAPSAAPKTQPAPVKQPAAGTKSATKSFADATASKKPAAPAQTPRPAPAQKNSTAEKIITEVLMAIQTSTSTEQILAKVLAIIPKVLT